MTGPPVLAVAGHRLPRSAQARVRCPGWSAVIKHEAIFRYQLLFPGQRVGSVVAPLGSGEPIQTRYRDSARCILMMEPKSGSGARPSRSARPAPRIPSPRRGRDGE